MPTQNFSRWATVSGQATASRRATAPGTADQTLEPAGKAPPPDFRGLPSEKQDLAEKLSDVSVWAGRIAELLSRFSAKRIWANFQLYRQRAAEQTIRKPGAWLWKAITDGYALSDCNLDNSSVDNPSVDEPREGESGETSVPGSLPPLEHKEIVSEAKKDRYVSQGTSEDRFHRCPSGKAFGRTCGRTSRRTSKGISEGDGPAERRFMYFDPEMGGPRRRV